MTFIYLLIIIACVSRLGTIINQRSATSKPTNTDTISFDTILKHVKENQRKAMEEMGPDSSLDPAAKFWAEQRKEMFKPGWEKDPEVVALHKMMREKYQHELEQKWMDEINHS